MRLPPGGEKPHNSPVITASAGQPKDFFLNVPTLTPTIPRPFSHGAERVYSSRGRPPKVAGSFFLRSRKGRGMSLGMIVRQPRHVIAKLNGWSESEEHEVLDRTKGVEWGPDREPVFSVAECRLRTTEVRTEPAASVRSAIALLTAEHEAFLKREEEESDRRKQQLERHLEESKVLRDDVCDRMKGLSNATDKAHYLTTKQVATRAGWGPARVRKHTRAGDFKNSLLPDAVESGKHRKFDPVKVMEDIKAIKNKAGTKGRRKRK